MCFAFDARPPAPPPDLMLAPIAGGAGAELLELSSADGTRFSAALAQSTGSSKGGIVILPDVRGLYPFYTELAERFAQVGYHAIALDYFGRTAGLGPRGEDFDYWPHMQQVRVTQVQADATAAVAALRQRTDARAVATVGFCFGGLHSFLAAADVEYLTAVVGFYGVLDAERFGITNPGDRAPAMRCPVLGLFGGADPAIPVGQVEQFDERLKEATIDHEVHVYPGAPHSFFDRRYDDYTQECEDAWRRMLGFLGRHLAAA